MEKLKSCWLTSSMTLSAIICLFVVCDAINWNGGNPATAAALAGAAAARRNSASLGQGAAATPGKRNIYIYPRKKDKTLLNFF